LHLWLEILLKRQLDKVAYRSSYHRPAPILLIYTAVGSQKEIPERQRVRDQIISTCSPSEY